MDKLQYNAESGLYRLVDDTGKVLQDNLDTQAATEISSQLAIAGEAQRTSPTQAAVIKAGQAFDALNPWGSDQSGNAQGDAAMQQAHPIASMVGESVPYMSAAALAASVPGAQGLLPQIGLQAGAAGLVGYGMAPEGQGMERGLTEAAWAAGGGAAGNMAGRIFNRFMGRYRPTPAGDYLKRGGDLTPGQASDSELLQRVIEPPVESAGAFNQIRKVNQQTIKDQSWLAMGQKGAPDLTRAGRSNAAEEIGGRMNAILKGKQIEVTADMSDTLAKIGTRSDLIEFPDIHGNMTGKVYQQVRRKLSDIVSTQQRSQSPVMGLADEATGLINQIDEAFGGVVGKEQQQAYRVARENWKVLKTMERGKAVTPDGEINPTSLYNAQRQNWGDAAIRKDHSKALPETQAWIDTAADQSSTFSKSVVGNSGTAERSGAGAKLYSSMAGGGAAAGLMAAPYLMADADQREQMLMGGAGGAAGASLPLIYGASGRMAGGRYSPLIQMLFSGGAAAYGNSLMDE